ncbi:hypothetical protein AVEN_213434-1 [Araneus ventricosus]|uniref:Uncharacterized protein n=1 Tax=Araneus ventricosus TaxID=182803 RepID=A0A4Y2JX78_ARAVE|nr:hypothetical protein AVEN_213434-1 [Araneus ventricosus]
MLSTWQNKLAIVVAEVFWQMFILIERRGEQTTIDNIYRCHKLSCEIKVVEIGPVVWTGGITEDVFPLKRYSDVLSTIGEISRGHMLPYETKVIEIGQWLWLGDLSSDFGN